MFNGSTETLKSDRKNISLEYLAKIVKKAIYTAIIIILLTIYNNNIENLKWFYKSEGNKEKIRSLEDLVPAWRNKYIIIVLSYYPLRLIRL